MNYAEYIVSAEWAAKRRKYLLSGRPTTCRGLREDGTLCERKPVDLHHWTYKRLGREQLDDLVAVCRDCHDRIHDLARGRGPKALRRATETVCGNGVWNGGTPKRKKQPKLRGQKAARLHLKADAVPLLATRGELTRELEALGAAIKRGEYGKPLLRRLQHVRLIADRVGEDAIARAVARYRVPKGPPSSVHGAIKPWDTARVRLASSPSSPYKRRQRKRRKEAA